MENFLETHVSKTDQKSSKSAVIAALVLLVFVPLVTFGPSVLRDHFVNWDDEGQLYQNPDFNPPSVSSVIKYWHSPHMNLYIPVTYTLWGSVAALAQTKPDAEGISLDPIWFHALNLILHMGASLVVFAVLRKLIIGMWPAFAGAMFFAVHPIQAEAVCWASGMYTVLSGFMIFLAILEYVRFARSPGKEKSLHYLCAGAIYSVALLCKPSAVVAIPIAGIIDLLLLRRRWQSTVAALAPWVILALPIVIILHYSQPAGIVPDQPVAVRVLVAFDTVGFYISKITFPSGFAVDYGRNPVWLRAHPAAWAMALLPVGAMAVSWVVRRRFPWFLAGMGIFVAGLLPFLGLVKFDFQHFSTVADRYTYPAMLGVALVVAAVLDRWKIAPLRWATGVILGGLAAGSFAQSTVWQDTRTLVLHTDEVNPQSLQANSNLGFLDMRAGDVDAAIAHYKAALIGDPNDPNTNTDLANALRNRGDLSGAIEHYRTALAVTPSDPRIENNLGVALAQSHQFDEASRVFQSALTNEKTDSRDDRELRAQAHTNLGRIAELEGRVDRARLEYQAALAEQPGYPLAAKGITRLGTGTATLPSTPQ